MHILHLPRFWKHKETKEVIDHATYSDLKSERSDFDECDVTGELLSDIEQKKKDFFDNLGKGPSGELIDLDEIERLATMPVGENNEPVIANEEGNTENNTDGSTTTP